MTILLNERSLLIRIGSPSKGPEQHTSMGELYRGTILEHLLVQNLTAFFNVGEHNIIKLEGADWNDGMDMAAQRGESVAFTAMYASNLRRISQFALQLQNKGFIEVLLAVELLPLLDTLQPQVNYNSVEDKLQSLRSILLAFAIPYQVKRCLSQYPPYQLI